MTAKPPLKVTRRGFLGSAVATLGTGVLAVGVADLPHQSLPAGEAGGEPGGERGIDLGEQLGDVVK